MADGLGGTKMGWVLGRPFGVRADDRQRHEWHRMGDVHDVAVVQVDGRPAVAAGGFDGVHLWDVSTGEPIVSKLRDPEGARNVVAFSEIDGRTAVLTAGELDLYEGDHSCVNAEEDGVPRECFEDGQTIGLYDVVSGKPVAEPFFGPCGYVTSGAAARDDDGLPLVVSASRYEPVQAWIGDCAEQLTADGTDDFAAVTCAMFEGRRLVVLGLQPGDQGLRGAQVWHLGEDGPVRELTIPHPGGVDAVAITRLGGRPVLVTASGLATTGGPDHALWVWDLADGSPVTGPLTGHTGNINALACTEVDGRLLVITGGMDRTARVWDLSAGHQVGSPFAHSDGPVEAVALAEVDGCAVAVSADNHGHVRLWDPLVNEGASEAAGHAGRIRALTCAEVDGRRIAVTAVEEGLVHRWDLATGEQVGSPIEPRQSVCALTASESGGRPIMLATGGSGLLETWDLASGVPVGGPTRVSAVAAEAIACTMLGGRPVAVVGDAEHTVRIWGLADRGQIGQAMVVRTGGDEDGRILSLACTTLAGRPVALVCGAFYPVGVLDLATGRPVGEPLADGAGWKYAVVSAEVDGRPMVVSTGDRDTFSAWDLASGEFTGRAPRGMPDGAEAACVAYLGGRVVAVLGGPGWLRVWDLATASQVGPEITVPGRVVALSATGDVVAVAFGRQVAVLRAAESTSL